jgi:hypothetical protein
LKIDLADAIAICQQEKVLSERTAALCSVIRSYRNLIHPGRMVRLNEPAPDQNSANIALSLVDMITEEVAKVLRKTMGLTAEQIMSKVLRDANSLTILTHLLAEASDGQKERLLLELIPAQHEEAQAPDSFWTDDDMPRLEKAYRMALDTCGPDLRQKVAMQFVSVLRDADGARVLRYGKAFFQPRDIKHLPQHQRRIVIDHLLSTVGTFHNAGSLLRIRGIEDFLAPEDAMKWLDPYLQTLFTPTVKEALKETARNQLLMACSALPDAVDKAIDTRLNDWLRHFEKQGARDKAEVLRKLAKEIEDNRLPF